jgi:hypothetical protein
MGIYENVGRIPPANTTYRVDISQMFRDSLRWHARLDVSTSDGRDYQVMLALTSARKVATGRGTAKRAAGNALVEEIRRVFGADPRKRPF